MLITTTILTTSGACISTVLAGYLTYKSHKRFGKVDRIQGRTLARVEKLFQEAKKSGRTVTQLSKSLANSLSNIDRRQATLESRLARNENVLWKMTERLKKLDIAVTDAQLETGYLSSLNTLPLRYPLFFGRWSIDGVTAKCIVETVRDLRPKVIVELGSGSSTVLVAATLQALGDTDARHIAVDHLEEFLAITRENLRVQDLSREAEFWHCPLSPRDGADEPAWYSGLPERLGDTKIDLLIVDGPPGHVHPEARRPAMEILGPFLSERAVVILDDSSREEEKRILEIWCEKDPSLKIEMTAHGKGCARVFKMAPHEDSTSADSESTGS